AGATQAAGNELGGQPEPAGDRRGIGGRTLAGFTVGRTVGMVPAEPFAEIPQPGGEHGLVGVWLVAITLLACVVAHAFDTRDVFRRSRLYRRLRGARTIGAGPK